MIGRLLLALYATSVWSAPVQAQEIRADSVRAVAAHRGALTALAWSNDGRWVASAGVDGRVRLWNASTMAPHSTLSGHRSEVYTATFSASGKLLASSSYDGEVRVWSVPDGRVVSRTRLASWSIALDFVADTLLAVGDQAGTLQLIDARNARTVSSCKADAAVNAVRSLGSTRVLAGGPIVLWNLRTCTKERSFNAPGGVTALATDRSLQTLASAHMRGVVYRWSVSGGAPLDSLVSERPASIAARRGTVTDTVRVPITTVTLSPDARVIVYGDARGNIRIHALPAGQTELLNTHRGSVTALATSPDGLQLVSGGTDGLLRLWRLTRPGQR